MKQRLLLALLVLFAAAGMVRAGDGDVTVQSNGTKEVTITFTGATITTPNSSNDNVKISDDKKKITVAQGYTTPVPITATGATNISFTGNMTSLEIENNDLKSISLQGCYIKSLTIKSSSTDLTTLDCSSLGLETLSMTGVPALTNLNASDNKLSSLTGLPVSLTNLNISNNTFTSFDPTTLINLTDLDVSNNSLTNIDVTGTKLTKLARLNLSGNKIIKLTGTSPVSTCTVTWGVQTYVFTTGNESPANKGVNIKKLIKQALSLSAEPESYSGVSWKIQDGTEYKDDLDRKTNTYTAHEQSPTYPGEYRFYKSDSKIFVDGTYQCTVTTVDKRTYNLQNIKITPAEFTFSWLKPAHATALTVTQDGVSLSQGGTVKQGAKLLFSTTMEDGYDKVVYSIEGLKPTDGLTEPYAYNPFECTVEGKYENVATSIVPKMSAIVSGAKHVVKYEASDIAKGGTFTVEKELTDGTKVALKNMEEIATGDKLVVTVLPALSYTGNLRINNEDKNISSTKNVYSYTVLKDDKDFNIAVTFTKDQIKIEGKIDGEDLSSSMTIAYLDGKKILVDGTTDVPSSSGDVYIAKNTDHQLKFTIDQSATEGTNRVLDVVTINGGERKSVTSSTTGTKITYTVSFSVKEDDVIVSIKTKKVTPVTIELVKNAKQTSGSSANDKQEQMYTGQSLPLRFTTNPAGLESQVVVEYKKGGAALGTTAPVAVGDYTATMTFKETADYVLTTPSADLTDFAYSITKASLSIETLPQITVNKEGKYEITGGKVKFGKTEIAGKFEPLGATTGNAIQGPEPGNVGKTHNVNVKFTPNSNADQDNFNSALATVLVEVPGSILNKIKASIYTPLPTGITLELYNGDKLINPTTESFIEGTKLKGVVIYPIGTTVTLEPTSNITGTTITPNTNLSVDGKDVYDIVLNGTTQFKVTANAANTYTVKLQKQTVEYNGEAQSYNTTSGLQIFDKDGVTSSVSAIVTYKDKAGNSVPLPINAGEYTVGIKIKADATNKYSEYNNEFASAFVITKTRAIVYKWPVASKIAKGMPLSQSALSRGAASIPGTFAWENETEVPPVEGGKYKVVFTPATEYIQNYEKVVTPSGTADGGSETDLRVTVEVSDLQIVTFAPKNGKVTVVNQHGTSLESGNAVSKGDVLTITSTPDDGFELKSLTVNGKSYSTNYTVGESSVSIVATFDVKTVVDPNTQYTVTLPKANAVKGIIINKPGVNAVKKDGSFSFTLGSLAADAKNIVVTVDGTTLTPVDGTYTIAKVDGNKIVTVTLSTPTKIKVSVEKETKNAKGNVMGKVQVEGLSTTDSTCYYGNEVTIVAFPESGVTFAGWSGSITSTDKLATFTVKEPMTIKPKFTGVPTGIETIQDTRIYGREGHIFIGCDGEAKVTLISMDGRVKKVEISGDTRIEMAAGIYGVVVEKGSDRMQTKVIVR